MTRSSLHVCTLLSFATLLFTPACGDLDSGVLEQATERKGTSKQTTDETEDPLSPSSPKHPKPGPGDDPDPDPDPPPVPAEKLEGLHIKQIAGFTQTISYEMSHRPSANPGGYAAMEIRAPFEGWPAHGMQWKALHASVVVDLAAASTLIQSVPFFFGLSVRTGDAAHMNDLQHSPVFPVGTPTGTWMEISIPGAAQAFAFAALTMHFWDTPVYVGAQHNYLNSPGYAGNFSHTIALQELAFDVPTNSDLFSVCGIPQNATPTTALTQVLNCNQGFVINSGETTLWNDFLSGNYVPYDPNRVLSGQELVTTYLGTNATQHLVFDPPEEATEEDILGLRVMSEALADQMLVADEDGILITVENFVADLESDDKK